MGWDQNDFFKLKVWRLWAVLKGGHMGISGVRPDVRTSLVGKKVTAGRERSLLGEMYCTYNDPIHPENP